MSTFEKSWLWGLAAFGFSLMAVGADMVDLDPGRPSAPVPSGTIVRFKQGIKIFAGDGGVKFDIGRNECALTLKRNYDRDFSIPAGQEYSVFFSAVLGMHADSDDSTIRPVIKKSVGSLDHGAWLIFAIDSGIGRKLAFANASPGGGMPSVNVMTYGLATASDPFFLTCARNTSFYSYGMFVPAYALPTIGSLSDVLEIKGSSY